MKMNEKDQKDLMNALSGGGDDEKKLLEALQQNGTLPTEKDEVGIVTPDNDDVITYSNDIDPTGEKETRIINGKKYRGSKKQLESTEAMWKVGAMVYAKYGHLSKAEREKHGIWIGDGKQ